LLKNYAFRLPHPLSLLAAGMGLLILPGIILS